MKVHLLRLKVIFNTGGTFIFMVCRTLGEIKVRTKMQVDIFIFIFFCYLFGVDAMRVNPMVVVK